MVSGGRCTIVELRAFQVFNSGTSFEGAEWNEVNELAECGDDGYLGRCHCPGFFPSLCHASSGCYGVQESGLCLSCSIQDQVSSRSVLLTAAMV